jgi:hypothetical protein
MYARNRWTVRVHSAVADDIDKYESDLRFRSPTIELSTLIAQEFHELKRILARSGGKPAGSFELNESGVYSLIRYVGNRRARMDLESPDVKLMEYNYLRSNVWVSYSRDAKARLITILSWTAFSFGSPETRPH